MNVSRFKRLLVTFLATIAMLAVTCFADEQSDLIARIRANPMEDFSQLSGADQHALADADAMAYFQDHNDIKDNVLDIGEAHAFKHHLIGHAATLYSVFFANTIRVLGTKD
jgi:hypothetical protein